MRRILVIVFVLFCVHAITFAQPPNRYERSLKRKSQNKYLVVVPQNYNPKKKYPLFIAIHSKGGPMIEQYNQWNFFSSRNKYIMLCPQFFGGYPFFRSGEDRSLIAMMREMKSEFPYDSNKVFIAGFSTGADFVQNFVFQNPGRVSAAGVLAARNYSEPPYSGKGRKVKYYIGVGADDSSVIGPSRRFYQQLQSKGYDVQFQEFPSTGHVLNDDMKRGVMDFFKRID